MNSDELYTSDVAANRCSDAGRLGVGASIALSLLFAGFGCAHIPNQFADDSPAVTTELQSPTTKHVYAEFQPSKAARRDWPTIATAPENGAVVHWPLYFEDPFEDKGHEAINPGGRSANSRYYIGWEDYVALGYGYPRYWLNTLGLPVSMVVQPPWTAMESDGELSQQALGMDHDATPLGSESGMQQSAPAPAPTSTAASQG